MIIHFEFAVYFSQHLGEKQHSIELPEDEATLDQAVEAFFRQFPGYKDIFEERFYNKGKIFALFVCCGNILQPESVLKDGDRVKVVTPISGG